MSDFEKRISELPPEKRELLALFLGEKDSGAVWLQGAYTAPRNPKEELLATLWQEVIGLERVGIDDNFFEIGGDSLHCIQIVARCRESGLQLTVNDLFEHPTISELAAIADAVSARRDSTIAPVRTEAPMEPAIAALIASDDNIEDAYGLSPMQEGMLFHTLANPAFGLYFGQGTLTLRGEMDLDLFESAWREIVYRHPVLRSAFAWEGLQRPVQMVFRQADPIVERFDWRGLAESEQEQRLQLYLESSGERGVELNKPPLMRLAFIRSEDEVYHVIWGIHHLIHDAWSTFVILQEVLAAYEARRTGRPLNLKPARPYRDFIAWLEQHDLQEAETFWRETLRDYSPPASLIADLHGREGQMPALTCDRQETHLDPPTTDALHSFARRHRLTLNTVVLGAWALLLGHYSARTDIVFGIAVSGRLIDLPDAGSIIGPLFNALPFRVSVATDEPLGSWLAGLQSRLAEIQRYEHTSLRQVQVWSKATRGTALFETLLAFQNVSADIFRERAGLQISDIKSIGYSNIPLSIVITPRAELWIEALYQRRRFSASRIQSLIGDLGGLLSRMASAPDAGVNTFRDQAASGDQPSAGSRPYPKKLSEVQPKAIKLSFEESDEMGGD